ncbi:Hypothetical protein, putative [Bodo saltans]|uniref:Uncharacterized protein n=1 Tax=Bodo saltans TaxID=75058 RepID=A0A0S4JPS9_BODSA|nr:Hypothetical protein, putative [Bodo saltans]|eukprot:CUG92323.1 Hypothetical protein, putative [Bodo saltans]
MQASRFADSGGGGTPPQIVHSAPSIEYSGSRSGGGGVQYSSAASPYYHMPLRPETQGGYDAAAATSSSPWRQAVSVSGGGHPQQGLVASSPQPHSQQYNTPPSSTQPQQASLYSAAVSGLMDAASVVASGGAVGGGGAMLNEVIWKQRVKDRDDVVRDLMKRILQLEQENESLHFRLQDIDIKHRYSKDCGTNTTFEWVVEQQQRTQLIALEEYMRFQEVCLYAEWFGLSLSYHRQVFHTLRMQQQLTQIADTMHKGIVTPQVGAMAQASPSPPRHQQRIVGDNTTATMLHGDDVTLLRLRGVVPSSSSTSGGSTLTSSSLMLRASVGMHTPSSATGTPLHLLRGLDALQSTSLERLVQDIQHGVVMTQRRNRSQLREAARVHEQLVNLLASEASARHAMELEALTTSFHLFRADLAQKLHASSERQVRLLTIENKRMLEFSLSQSTAHHRVAQELSHFQHVAATEMQLVEQQSVHYAEEISRREITHLQSHLWTTLLGPAQSGGALEAQAREELRRHAQNLEGSSISLRHGEEPWARRFVEHLESTERNALYSCCAEVNSQVHHLFQSFERRERLRGAAVLLHETEAIGSAFLESHQLFLQGARTTLMGLQYSISKSEGRVRRDAQEQLLLIHSELKSRGDLDELRTAEFLRLSNVHTRAREEDSGRQHAVELLDQANHVYSRDLLRMTTSVRKDALDYLASITAQTSTLVADTIVECNDALASLRHWVRKTSRLERDEQRWRSELLLCEESEYYHTVLLPFVLALRESELNEEYGSLFVNVEDQTRKIMRRTMERESSHVDFFADEGLIAGHIDLGESLFQQHIEFCRSIGMFLRDDVRRSQQRLQDTCKAAYERDLDRVLADAAADREALIVQSGAQVEHARRTTSEFWKDVFTTEASRLQNGWVRFACCLDDLTMASCVLQMSRFVAQLWRDHRSLHSSAQTAQLDYVLNGPIATLISRQYQTCTDLVQGTFVSVKSLQRSLSAVSVSGQQEVRELLELKEVRYKQQVQHAERLYLECRLQLDKEVRLRDGERVTSGVINEEQRRRAEVHAAEAHELLWFVYRSNTVQRFLVRTTGSLSPNRGGGGTGGGGSSWPHAARSFLSSQQAVGTSSTTTIVPSSLFAKEVVPPSAAILSQRDVFESVPLQRGSQSGGVLGASPLVSQGSLTSSHFAQRPDEPHLSSVLVSQRLGSISGAARSTSEASSMFGTVRSDADTAQSSVHQNARARRSSLVMSRSMERQRSLRGDEGSPEPRYAAGDNVVQSRHLGADGNVLGNFSPSPLTRAELMSRNERQLQSQMRLI